MSDKKQSQTISDKTGKVDPTGTRGTTADDLQELIDATLIGDRVVVAAIQAAMSERADRATRLTLRQVRQ